MRRWKSCKMKEGRPIIISLFDLSGSWSDPYREAGYEVIRIDIELGIDVLEWDYKEEVDRERVRGILAAPPCDKFTAASSQYWRKYDENGKTDYAVSLVRKVFEIIDWSSEGREEAVFWCLENPPGRIEKLIPELVGKRVLMFHPWEFGDPYTKRTILWGRFNPFLVRRYIKIEHFDREKYDWSKGIVRRHKLKYPGFNRKQLRSVTPAGFALAFFNANR